MGKEKLEKAGKRTRYWPSVLQSIYFKDWKKDKSVKNEGPVSSRRCL